MLRQEAPHDGWWVADRLYRGHPIDDPDACAPEAAVAGVVLGCAPAVGPPVELQHARHAVVDDDQVDLARFTAVRPVVQEATTGRQEEEPPASSSAQAAARAFRSVREAGQRMIAVRTGIGLGRR